MTAYEELLARARAELEPADILEEISVRELVDNAWERCFACGVSGML